MNLTIAILCTEQITPGWDIYGDDLVTSDHPGTGGLRCHGAHYPLAPALWSPRVIPGSGLPQWQSTHYCRIFRTFLHSDAIRLLMIPSSLDEQL